MEKKQLFDEDTMDVRTRTSNRNGTLFSASVSLMKYYIGLGDDVATAKDKVDQIADVIYDSFAGAVLGYESGVTRQKVKLIAAIEGIDEVAFPFFDAAAKQVVTDKLQLIT